MFLSFNIRSGGHDMVEPFTTTAEAREFMFGGRALFTAQSLKTNHHYTYRVRKSDGDLWFVHLRTSSDAFTYMGVITHGKFKTTSKSRYNFMSPPVKAFEYILASVQRDEMPTMLRITHEGKCCVCGRTLTNPESLKTGIGPECAKRSA
jgi:Family of unknown function (DUF6011)